MQTKTYSNAYFAPAPAVAQLRRIFFALSLCLGLAGIQAGAATRVFTSTSDGAWTKGTNWDAKTPGTLFAGEALNATLADEGLATDVASFTNVNISVGINMTTLAADDGVGLSLAEIGRAHV